MEFIEIEGFVSFTIAIVLLFVGKAIIEKITLLRLYSIPESVVGGFLCAVVIALIYFIIDIKVIFDLEARDTLLLYFFAAMGLNTDIKSLLKGGKPLIILTALAAVYIVMQNGIGMGMASLFGMDPKAGLMSGSISLTGGVGTTLAWAPTFTDKLGITNAMEIGVASNTIGMIFACVIGGPIATYLMKKHKLKGTHGDNLDIGTTYKKHEHEMVDSYSILFSWLSLNIALIMGYGLDILIDSTGLQLPMFVSCLLAGIIIKNRPYILIKKKEIPGSERGLSLLSDICLGMFIVMALMDLKMWELHGLMTYLTSVMALQILMTVLFTIFVVYRFMGKDYEAAVICSGFGGITLGSSATAIANMTAVSKQNGPAHKAFIVVPLVCGFFIDIFNSLAINFFVTM